MFEETPRNKMLRKMPLNSYPQKSYLPIYDDINLERSPLLRMHRNIQALQARFKFFKF